MAIKYSTALRNFLQGFGSKKQALTGGVFRIYSGSAPTSADSAVTGDLLVQVTLGGAGWTSEVLSSGTVTLTGGASGSVDTITVNSVSILPAAVSYNTSLTQTATDVVTAINKGISSPRYMASSSGAVITIKAMPGTGIGPNTYEVASTVTTITKTDVNLSGGVAQVNGLTYDNAPLGVLTKTGTWSGTVLVTGTAGYFVMTGSRVDGAGSDSSPWNLIRLMGTCGTSGADYNMATTSLTLGATHTIDTWIETLSE